MTAARDISRRDFLGYAGAISALAGATPRRVPNTLADPRPYRIDLHHHISPPTWLDAVKKAKLDFPPAVAWTPERSIAEMDRAGTAIAVVAPTMPHVAFLGPADAARVARESNEYAKRLMSDHPGRFGVLAMLPMPHIEESLQEIEHALDVLKADGIAMMTSYGDKWLGYPEFAPVFEELDRRAVTVCTHPNRADCCLNLVRGISDAVVEYGADTTRTIASLIFSGTSQRFKNVTFTFAHGGGVLTAVVERFQDYMVRTHSDRFTRAVVDGELRRFYYDTAQVANPVTLAALTKLVPVSQLLFGTDYPFRPSIDHVRGLAAFFGAAELRAIERENALRILPALRNR